MTNAHNETAVGKTIEWYTPPELFDAIGLMFDLDPASPGAESVPWLPADTHYTIHENGLMQPWHGRIWLNPPYGRLCPAFMDRLVQHDDGMALVYGRTETRWFQHAATHASAVTFLRERIWFVPSVGEPARSQMGSVLMAFGLDCAAALRDADLGWTVR